MQPGNIIDDKYTVIAVIGSGGMGTVLRVRRNSDSKTFALKYCNLPDEIGRRRFFRETRVMKRIQHPHVMQILDISEGTDPPYFLMPLADSSCAAQIDQYSREEAKAIAAFTQICHGVQALHIADLVHRDIKPDNALLIGGLVVVADLGLTREVNRNSTVLTQTHMVIGTEAYLAPEQRLPGGSRDADTRTDIYQLGKTFYHLLTGLPPAMIDFTRLPPGIAHVIRKATAETPSERFSCVGELLDELSSYTDSRDPQKNPTAAFESVISRIRAEAERGEYLEANIKEMLDILSYEAIRKEPMQWLAFFDMIPKSILEVIPAILPDRVVRLLEEYVGCLDSNARNCAFSYADGVATRCKAIFEASAKHPKVRALCLEALLIAATQLNRFAAIDALAKLLVEVQTDEEAWLVRAALQRHPGAFRSVAAGIPAITLHPALRPPADKPEA